MHVVVTFTGRDRPGVVHRLADIVRAHDGNWEESRMAHLAGRFAGILEVSLPADRVPAFTEALEGLSEQGVRILVDTGEDTRGPAPSRPYRLEVTGTDRPGIVRDLTEILLEHGVNIQELETNATEAPMTGGFLFEAIAQVDLPEGLSKGTLAQALERLADHLFVELYDPSDE